MRPSPQRLWRAPLPAVQLAVRGVLVGQGEGSWLMALVAGLGVAGLGEAQ